MNLESHGTIGSNHHRQPNGSKGLQSFGDIWNEPAHHQSGIGAPDSFFETWKRAVRTIRRVNLMVIIVGPSFANGPCNYLYGFLLSAHAHNVLPDIISWHDMDLDHPTNVVNVRQFMAKHGISDRPISINEFRYFDGMHRPGHLVWWLSRIEEEAPKSAAYSCWPDQEGYSNCETYTLDGLLSRGGSRRASWFAHKGYAEITGCLISVESLELRMSGLAGVDTDLQTGRLILGKRKNLNALDEESVEVVFRNVDRFGSERWRRPSIALNEFQIQAFSIALSSPLLLHTLWSTTRFTFVFQISEQVKRTLL